MSYFDILEHARSVYITDCRKAALAGAGRELTGMVRDKYVSEENRIAGTALLYKLRLKNAFLSYMAELDDETLATLMHACEVLEGSDDDGCRRLADTMRETLELFTPAVAEINRIYFGLYDEMGEVRTDEGADVVAAASLVAKERTRISEAEISNPFGEDGVRIPDVKTHLLKKIDAVLSNLNAQKETVLAACDGAAYDDLVTLYAKDDLPYIREGFVYYPSLWRLEDKDRVRVLHTPYREEATLLAASDAKMHGRALAILDIPYLADSPKGFWAYFAARMREADVRHILVIGLKHLGDRLRSALAQLLSLAIRDGRYVYLFDELAGETPSLFRTCYQIVKSDKRVLARVSYHYLSMPAFEETVKLLESAHKLPGAGDKAQLKRTCPFMGFVGLNRMMLAPVATALDAGRDISEENRTRVAAYISRIPSRLQFIDEGWGSLGDMQFTSRRDVKRMFDYDALDATDRRYISSIMENDKISFTQKCGRVVRYALLLTEEPAAWQALGADVKEARVTRAVHLLCRTFDLEHKSPLVEVHTPEEDESMQRSGGYCAEGGRRIVFNARVTHDYSFADVHDVICHELFHALQFHIIRCGWQAWHHSQLGITESRVQRWKENLDGKYQRLAEGRDAYLVQILEADARSFAEEAAQN